MIGTSRHLFYCIPLKAAVFVSSLLSFISSATGAAAFFWLVYAVDSLPDLSHGYQVKVVSGVRTGLIVAGSILTVVAIISLLGLVGSVIKNRRILKTYSMLVWIGIFFSLTLTAFASYLVSSQSMLIECHDGHMVSCSSIVSSIFSAGKKAGFVITNVIGLLFHLDVCVVIRRYVKQLEDELAYKNDSGLSKETSYYTFQAI